MSTDERMQIVIEAIDHYGNGQIDMAIEEMGELIQALSKYKRFETMQSIVNVIEEIADVMVMMYQMATMFGVDEVDNMIEVKLTRLKERMENERARDSVEDTVSDFLMEDAPGDQARA